ncbi:MAG: hypothetical protein AAGJ10_11500 [Bacteroidota bacterium]
MSGILQNILVLTFCWLAATGAGVYLTFFDQPKEIERLEKIEQVNEMKQAEFRNLVSEEEVSSQRANEVTRRWNARYKLVPQTLSSASVVGTLNALTREGFEEFNIVYDGQKTEPAISSHKFSISGQGYYTHLYKVIWDLENGRELYRIQNLDLTNLNLVQVNRYTQKEEMKVMVEFTFEVVAYFGGTEGLSADDAGPGVLESDIQVAALPELPEGVLPAKLPNVNPFYPGILQTLPPNSNNLIDVEDASLISVAGERAYFDVGGEYKSVALGGDVYLGTVTALDPHNGRVKVRLNKGGIIDHVEIRIDEDEAQRAGSGGYTVQGVGW